MRRLSWIANPEITISSLIEQQEKNNKKAQILDILEKEIPNLIEIVETVKGQYPTDVSQRAFLTGNLEALKSIQKFIKNGKEGFGITEEEG